MATTEELKDTVLVEIDRRGGEAIQAAETIMGIPEPGFRERKTAKFVADKFKEIGIPYQGGIGITGLKGVLNGGTPGPTVAVIGELDSLIVRGHPDADPETDAAHACGHNCQIGMLLAVAMGLKAGGVMESLAGRVALIAVPAEEYIEIEYRDDLRRQGKLGLLAGKQEFIRLGAFDDVDMAMMTHTATEPADAIFTIGGTSNGMLAKRIAFAGKAAHAGSAPYAGVNALNAAMIALSAIHAQRETFRDEDTIRIHPIITRGGGAVSAVPDDVRMETFVRGRTLEAVTSAARKVDRALRAGALAVGGSVTITTLPGYFPFQSDRGMEDLHRGNAASLVGGEKIAPSGHETGSTDMGDVSQVMPVVHPYVVAAKGEAHGIDYAVDDYGLAVVTAAKAMAATVVDLLAEGGRRALQIKADYRAPMTVREYLSHVESFFSEKTYTE